MRAAPDSAGARHDLVEALEEAGKDAEAAREIYDAARAGVPGFIERLLHEMPDRATTRMLEHAEQAESPWPRMAAAAAWRARGEPLRAARILLGILEDARAEPLPAPLVWSCIATVRELLRARELDAAIRLRDPLRRSFSDHGTELATLAGDTAAQWAIVSELIALHPYVPPTLWRAFLTPLEDTSLARAEEDVRRFADEHRLVLQQLSFACERLAPTLFSLFADELTAVREDAVKARIRKLPRPTAVAFWAVVIVVLVVVWGLLRGSPHAEGDRTAPGQDEEQPLR